VKIVTKLHLSAAFMIIILMAVDLVQATNISLDSRKTTYLFQKLSVALQKRNVMSYQNTFIAG